MMIEENMLKHLYVTLRMPVRAVAQELGKHPATIIRNMKRYKIQGRSKSEAGRGVPKTRTKRLLRYHEAKRGQVPWWIEQGMPNPFTWKTTREKISESNSGRVPWNKGLPRTEEEKEKMSESQRANINHPSRFKAGPRHPRWTGGRNPYYGEDWLKQRRLARKRDNYTCQGCGVPMKELLSARRLHVHHIVSRIEGGTNDLNNLVTLCTGCHIKAEQNPEAFKPVAMSIRKSIVRGLKS